MESFIYQFAYRTDLMTPTTIKAVAWQINPSASVHSPSFLCFSRKSRNYFLLKRFFPMFLLVEDGAKTCRCKALVFEQSHYVKITYLATNYCL